MAKTTVSKELAAQYPELEKYVGQTVDASVIQHAQSNARVNGKDAGKTSARALVNKNPEAKDSAPANTAAKKVATNKKRA